MRIVLAVLITGVLFTGPAGAAPTTELSKKARGVQTGQSRSAVIAQLGRPTWVRLPAESEEKFLELLWDNGKCAPVAVDFDPGTGQVTGVNGGEVCFDKKPVEMHPKAKHRCPGFGARSKCCK
jgi:hypothetical protein